MTDRTKEAIRKRHGIETLVRGSLTAMAAQNGVHVTILKRILKDARIAPKKVGRLQLITQSEIDEALAALPEG